MPRARTSTAARTRSRTPPRRSGPRPTRGSPAARTTDGRWWLRFRSFAIRYGESGPVTLVDAGIGPARSPLAADYDCRPGRLPAELAAAGIDAVRGRGDRADPPAHGPHRLGGPGRLTVPRRAHVIVQHPGGRRLRRGTPAGRPAPAARRAGPFAGGRGRHRAERGDTDHLDARTHAGTPVGAGRGRRDESVLITGDLLVHAVQLVDPTLAYTHDMDARLAPREPGGGARHGRGPWLVVGGVASRSAVLSYEWVRLFPAFI